MTKRIKSSDNGAGTDILARAMRRVFKEAVEEGVAPLREDVGTLREDVDRGLKTTDQNVQKQLSQHRKETATGFREIRKDIKAGKAKR